MRRAGGLVFLGLLLIGGAAGAEAPSCSVPKGLYEEWLAVARHATPRKTPKDALLGASTVAAPDTEAQQSIARQYQQFFGCLSDAAPKLDQKNLPSLCDDAAADRAAFLVCQSVTYIKSGRTSGKEFVDAFPAGKKGADIVWDLEAITVAGQGKASPPPLFLPDGPAFKLVDELFLLVLDDRENAAAKYFNISAYASDTGARHMDEQIKLLLRESPAVVVKQWAVLRQYKPRLKQLLADMAAALPAAELAKLRRGVAGFCTKDNLDCPEILKFFGRPE